MTVTQPNSDTKQKNAKLISFTTEDVEIPRPWLIRYEPDVPRQFKPSDLTLPAMLEETVQKYPSHVALIFLGEKTTYKALWDKIRHFCAILQKSGVKKGDRVAIMLPNTPQYVISYYGALMAGAIIVNTSPMYVPKELKYQLKDSESETLIILDTLYPRYAEIQNEVPLKRILVTGVQDALPFPLNIIYPFKAKYEKTWVEVPRSSKIRFWKDIFNATYLEPKEVEISPLDTALLQYTGGTTGLPKGAMLTHRNLISNCEQSHVWLGNINHGEEIILSALPFFHVYGMTVAMNMSVRIAATAVLIPNPRDIKVVLDQIMKHKASIFPGVPTLYHAIANYPDAHKVDLTSIKACISGSAPLLRQTVIDFKNLAEGSNVVEGYGLTEASPCTHINPVFINQREGIGLPMSGVDAIITDEDGNILSPNTQGELWVSGENVMKGYWKQPEETEKALVDAYGKKWLKTGDIAVMDEEGYFKIIDRKKDLIIVGGYNVYPREVEEVIIQHPAVLEVAAVGVPHPHSIEHVHAVIVLHENTALTQSQLQTFCYANMSPYKVPKSVEFRKELPKSSVMKVLRRQLAQEWIERNKKDT